MVPPVRVRVPPLLFCKDLQVKLSALSGRQRIERRFYHNYYHNGHSLEVLREEVVEAQSDFTMRIRPYQDMARSG